MKTQPGTIIKIAGPLVVAENVKGANLFDIASVGKEELMGEIIELRDNRAWIQVYEDTAGVSIGEPVVSTGKPLSLELGPGMMTRFYDGIQRPLDKIAAASKSSFIKRGINVPALDPETKWEFTPTVKKGDQVNQGDRIGFVQETEIIKHYIMVPPGKAGKVKAIKAGKFTVHDTVAVLETEAGEEKLTMVQYWPIRIGRPYQKRVSAKQPLRSGQRVIDTFFPILKGGSAATPGPFGSGKTVTQQSLAKWSDAQVIIYVGCGERGNEMTDVLKEFPELTDPKSGRPLMERTVLIANTSNMPIAAREASIYTGITLAEYYRDMGYDVALMADSTSRWAEALREISGRLEEMPGEEGYPAYLASRIAEFYERAGLVHCLGKDKQQGSVSVIGAVSPPGGDLSEPVSQSSLRVTKVFWALDGSLAYARHYPAIHWLNSYSLYTPEVDEYNRENLNPEFPIMRSEAMQILQREAQLQEIIRIVGMDSLSVNERILLDTAKSLREDYLQQNAFDDVDAYSSEQKQYLMLKIIMTYHQTLLELASENPDLELEPLLDSDLKSEIAQMKYIPESELKKLEKLLARIPKDLRKISEQDEIPAADKKSIHESISPLDEEVEELS